MRVLHVLHTSLPYVCGYSLRSDQILTLQRQQGIEVAVVSSAQQPDPPQMDPSGGESIDGIAYYRTPRPKIGPTPIREFRLMRALERRIRDSCALFHPDIIHAHSPILVGMPALRVAGEMGLPLVYEVRDLWENASVDRGKFKAGSVPYRVARALETRVLRKADAVVTIGETLRTELQSRTSRVVSITPNGADVEAFKPVDVTGEWLQKWNPNGERILAYIGSFQPYEGLDVLIKGMREIIRQRPGVRAVIAGDGPERAALERLAVTEGVTACVTFTGRVPHNQVREIYAVADVLVYPRIDTLTTRLTTPLKPLEALAMEKAVLVSDLPALRELVEPEVSGIAFEAGNPSKLANAAIRMLDDAALRRRLGKAGRESVVKERTWEASVARYLPIYQGVLSDRPR
jgi:PEP-CTERM/exosortase A-associated glycosyltransferase